VRKNKMNQGFRPRPMPMPERPDEGLEGFVNEGVNQGKMEKEEEVIQVAPGKLCRYTRKPCEYVAKPGMAERGKDVRDMMTRDPRDLPISFVGGQGGRQIKRPEWKNLCETCVSCPYMADTNDTYTAEQFDRINGPEKRTWGGNLKA
jgi:hypothetical protein